MAKMKLAAVSMVSIPDKTANLEKMLSYVDKAADQGTNLIAFPELCLPGLHPAFNMVSALPPASAYWFEAAEYVPEGPSVQSLIDKAKERDIYITWTMVERDSQFRNKTYNCAVLVGPEGFVGKYRKCHQPGTERLYLQRGNEIPVFDTKLGKIGLMICFDRVWAEFSRCLKLQGAEIIVAMSAWPGDIRGDMTTHGVELFMNAAFMNAYTNSVVMVDSCACSPDGIQTVMEGLELGHSSIRDTTGRPLAMTGWDEEMCIAEVDPIASMDSTYASQGLTGNDYIRDLRPDLYLPIYENYAK